MVFVRSTSLTRRMLFGLGLPMAALALLLGLGGALTINNIVEGVNDRILGASARAIAETLALEDNEVTLDIPPSALGMLENDARDNVYYSVRAGSELITGYPDLPRVKRPPIDDGQIVYEYAQYREFPIRIAAMARQVPRVRSLVIVEVAETLDARQALRDRMLGALAILELLLLALLLMLLPIAVHWGLRPLEAIRRHMEGRRKADFDPLPLDHVPNELRSLIAAVNSLLARLDNAVQGIRRFTADASHQMRTPLDHLAHPYRPAQGVGGAARRPGTPVRRRYRRGHHTAAAPAHPAARAGPCRGLARGGDGPREADRYRRGHP